jgi:hypothetical protein
MKERTDYEANRFLTGLLRQFGLAAAQQAMNAGRD